jgi:hypothetical protein
MIQTAKKVCMVLLTSNIANRIRIYIVLTPKPFPIAAITIITMQNNINNTRKNPNILAMIVPYAIIHPSYALNGNTVLQKLYRIVFTQSVTICASRCDEQISLLSSVQGSITI